MVKETLHTGNRARQLGRRIVRNRWVYVMMLPVVIYFIMFKYIPISYLRGCIPKSV